MEAALGALLLVALIIDWRFIWVVPASWFVREVYRAWLSQDPTLRKGVKYGRRETDRR